MIPSGGPAFFADKDQRAHLILEHRAARSVYNHAMDEHAGQLNGHTEIGIDESSDAFVDTPAYRRARGAAAEMTAIEQEYFKRLPRMAMAPCPICHKPLFRSFDPFGLDGLWWRGEAPPDEPPACPHFCLLMGAVDLRGGRPRPDFDVHPGPGAPFVVPRLLELPGTIAVISAIEMTDGARAYPVAYFAPRRPPVQTLAASWARTNFVYTTQLGAHAWRRADEPAPGQATPDLWDFALGPWLQQGKVRWCEPGSEGTTLSTAAPDKCPYLDLPGVRSPQVIVAAAPAAVPGE